MADNAPQQQQQQPSMRQQQQQDREAQLPQEQTQHNTEAQQQQEQPQQHGQAQQQQEQSQSQVVPPPKKQSKKTKTRKQRATARTRTPREPGRRRTLIPSWYGILMTTREALQIFEACFTGKLMHIPRRPTDIERDGVIRSGNVFIYEEGACGITRWTDGRSWSASRIMGNFLIYRELKPGVKEASSKKNKRKRKEADDDSENTTEPNPFDGQKLAADEPVSEERRALVGSLTNEAVFQPGGLMKKTISISYKHKLHHLVSYYTVEDAENQLLPRPSQFASLCYIQPRPDIVLQHYRCSLVQEDPELINEALLSSQPQVQTIPLQQPYMPVGYQLPPAPNNPSTGHDQHIDGAHVHNTSSLSPWNHPAFPQPLHTSYQLPGGVGNGSEGMATSSHHYYPPPAATSYTPPTYYPSPVTTSSYTPPTYFTAPVTTSSYTPPTYFTAPVTTSSYAPSLPSTAMNIEQRHFMPRAPSTAPPPPLDMTLDLPTTTPMDLDPPVSATAPMTMVGFPPPMSTMTPRTTMEFESPAGILAGENHFELPLGQHAMSYAPSMDSMTPTTTTMGFESPAGLLALEDPRGSTVGHHTGSLPPSYPPQQGTAFHGSAGTQYFPTQFTPGGWDYGHNDDPAPGSSMNHWARAPMSRGHQH